MAYESPLFQSSLELFSHSVEHFNWGTEKDRKFVILHLANSVELIFKDLLLDLGESIFKNPKETISVTGAIDKLTKEKGIVIPHFNKLELLIDERNSLQHRYGFPNELTTIFYMDATFNFFKEFLKDNYDLEIDEVLEDFLEKEDLATFQLRQATTSHELDKLAKLSKVHPIGALLSAYAYLEKQLNEIRELMVQALPDRSLRHERDIRMPLMRVSSPDNLYRLFQDYGIEVSEDERSKLRHLRDVRNLTAHGREEPEPKFVNDTIKLVKKIDPKISELKEKVKIDPLLSIRDIIDRLKQPDLFDNDKD